MYRLAVFEAIGGGCANRRTGAHPKWMDTVGAVRGAVKKNRRVGSRVADRRGE